MTDQTVTVAPTQGQPAKALNFEQIEALRKHMLLTVSSLVVLLGTTRVSYYNWINGKTKMRKATADHIRGVVRKLVAAVSQHNWPYDAVFVATQAERLQMLQDLLENLDKDAA